jgi:hypothetical protein
VRSFRLSERLIQPSKAFWFYLCSRPTWVLGALLVTGLSGLALSACGGGEDGKGTAANRAIEAKAQERARSIVLKLSDFPDYWRGSRHEMEPAAEERLRVCLGVNYSALTRIGDAYSDDFDVEGGTARAQSTAAVYESEQQAADAFEEGSRGMDSAAAEDCFHEIARQGVAQQKKGPDVVVEKVKVKRLSLRPSDVDEARRWLVVISTRITSGPAKGITPAVYINEVALREGDVVASVDATDVAPFDSKLLNSLLGAIAGRLSE